MTATTGGPRRPSLALLIAVTMTGTVALHVFIPALPAAAAELRASPFAAQLTITLFLCGLAVGQLVYGPVSDRRGRRPVLIASLVIYLGGALAAVPATTMEWLVGARVLQALGACGALVIGRAMVRDVSTADDAARMLALLIMCLTLTPSVAPALGGALEAAFGWRGIFVALAAVLVVLLVLVVATLPETHVPSAEAQGIRAGLSGYRRLARSAQFRHYVIAGSCSGTSLYAFLAVAPFLYIDVLGRSPQAVGLYCVIVSVGMAAGAALVRIFVGRVEIRRGARVGNLICLGAALSLLALHVAVPLSVVVLTAPMVVYGVGVGIAGPNIVAGALNVDPEAAGSASGLFGFAQMMCGALFTLAVGVWHDGSALPLAVVLVCASAAAAVSLQRV